MRKIIALFLMLSMLNYAFGFSMIEHYCLTEDVAFIETSLSPDHRCEKMEHNAESESTPQAQGACCKKNMQPSEPTCHAPEPTVTPDDCCTTQSSFIRIEKGHITGSQLHIPTFPLPILSYVFTITWAAEISNSHMFHVKSRVEPPDKPELAFLSVFRI